MGPNKNRKIAGILWILANFIIGEAMGFYEDLTPEWRIFSHVFNIGVGLLMVFWDYLTKNGRK
jgi:hypothetical protein